MALELRVSSEKYLNQIAMLEGQLALLKNLEAEYQDLQAQVPSFAGTSDAVGQLQQNVQVNIQRVDNAIESCNAAIRTLQANVSTMENVGQNISSIIEDSISIAGALS